MTYRWPLASVTNPGSVQIGSGLMTSAGGVLSTGGMFVESATTQTTTATDGIVMVDSMSLTPGTGTYRVLFNMNYAIVTIAGDITAIAAAELSALYTTLIALPTDFTHGPVFGSEPPLSAGVYDVASAANIAGTLTLTGSATDVFVFRIAGALTSSPASQVLLSNGAVSSNVFWVAAGAVALGITSDFIGTAIAHNAAASLGANSGMSGRLLSTTGAISTDSADSGAMSTPTSPSVINVGETLSTFVLFTSVGAVNNTNGGTYIGNIGTNNGAIAGYDPPTVVIGGIYPPGSIGPTATDFNTAVYANNVLIPTSLRRASSHTDIGYCTSTLQTTVSVAAGQTIDVRTAVIFGTLTVNNRDLMLFLA